MRLMINIFTAALAFTFFAFAKPAQAEETASTTGTVIINPWIAGSGMYAIASPEGTYETYGCPVAPNSKAIKKAAKVVETLKDVNPTIELTPGIWYIAIYTEADDQLIMSAGSCLKVPVTAGSQHKYHVNAEGVWVKNMDPIDEISGAHQRHYRDWRSCEEELYDAEDQVDELEAQLEQQQKIAPVAIFRQSLLNSCPEELNSAGGVHGMPGLLTTDSPYSLKRSEPYFLCVYQPKEAGNGYQLDYSYASSVDRELQFIRGFWKRLKQDQPVESDTSEPVVKNHQFSGIFSPFGLSLMNPKPHLRYSEIEALVGLEPSYDRWYSTSVGARHVDLAAGRYHIVELVGNSQVSSSILSLQAKRGRYWPAGGRDWVEEMKAGDKPWTTLPKVRFGLHAGPSVSRHNLFMGCETSIYEDNITYTCGVPFSDMDELESARAWSLDAVGGGAVNFGPISLVVEGNLHAMPARWIRTNEIEVNVGKAYRDLPVEFGYAHSIFISRGLMARAVVNIP